MITTGSTDPPRPLARPPPARQHTQRNRSMADLRASGTPSALAHQFDDLKQQHDSDELGMWLFLSTEIMFFGGLFLAYTIYRTQDEAAFAAASHQLDLFLGTLNTVVLLSS